MSTPTVARFTLIVFYSFYALETFVRWAPKIGWWAVPFSLVSALGIYWLIEWAYENK